PGTVYVSPGLPPLVVWILVLTFVLPALIPLGIFLGPALMGAVKSRNLTFPVVCGLNEELRIVGKTYSGPGTLITAENNCKLEIHDSSVEGGKVGISGEVNTAIIADGGEIRGHEAGIRLSINGHVRGRSLTIRSDRVAVEGVDNLELTGIGLTLSGGDVGLKG